MGVAGGPERPRVHHFERFFVLHAFWKALFAEFRRFGPPIGSRLGTLREPFCAIFEVFFSGSDFRSILGMLFGGAGGRGGVPGA